MLPENYEVIYNVLNVCFAFGSSIGFSYSILFGTRVCLCAWVRVWKRERDRNDKSAVVLQDTE